MPDGEAGGQSAGWFAGAAEDLFFAQDEARGGGEVDGAALAQVAVGGGDQRLGQPVQARVLGHGQVHVVGGVSGGGAAQGDGGGGRGEVQVGAGVGGGFEAQPVAAERGAHRAEDRTHRADSRAGGGGAGRRGRRRPGREARSLLSTLIALIRAVA